MHRLFDLFHGGNQQKLLQQLEQGPDADGADAEMEDADAPAQAAPDEDRVTPAGTPLRMRLLSLFCKSIAAANTFPGTMLVSPLPACLLW